MGSSNAQIADRSGTDAAQARLRGYNQQLSGAQDLVGNVGTGGMSTAQALQQAAGRGQGATDALLTSGLSGSRIASESVASDPILGQLFGKGGALSSALGKEQELQNQGFQLKPEDRSMYGQASGDIARLFGQQEQSAAQSLANRGLAAGPSGAAGVTFSGLAGNKNEQLAKAQMGIMQQRFQNTMNQIGQQQQFASQLAGQAGQNIQNQYGRQLQGAQYGQGTLSEGLNQERNTQAHQQDINNEIYKQQQESSFGNKLGGVLGGALGMGVGALTGGLGAAAGGKLAGSIFGANPSSGSAPKPQANRYGGYGNTPYGPY